jgi:hypothetical protein
VLAEAASRFAAAIKAQDDPAIHVDHLAFGIDAQSGTGVVHDGRRPGGVEPRQDTAEGWKIFGLPVHMGIRS